MAYAETHTVTIATAADGTAIGYTPVLTGKVINIIYTKTDFATGVDFDITAENSGIVLWDEDNVDTSKTVSPRQATHDKNGVEQSAAGDINLGDIYLTNERVKISIAAGGNAKTGTFKVIVGG